MGERNAKYFVGFIFVTTLLGLYTAATSLACFVLLVRENNAIYEKICENVWMLTVGGVLLLAGLIVLRLTRGVIRE